MRSLLLLCLFLGISANCLAQDWFTSFDVAKRLAIVQNKMLLVMWEDTLNYPYYVLIKDTNGQLVIANLNQNDAVNETIWEYFVPVILLEDDYSQFLDELKDLAGMAYMDKLNDDSIKIMDVNGRILNTNFSSLNTENLTTMIDLYALNTTYINSYLRNYLKEANFNTALALAYKYQDFGIFAKKNKTRMEIVGLADLYFKEARFFMQKEDISNEKAFLQKMDLLEIKSALIQSKPKRAKRLLKKYSTSDIDKINEGLFVFLKYTTFMILDEREEAGFWKDKLSEVDLRKAHLIININ